MTKQKINLHHQSYKSPYQTLSLMLTIGILVLVLLPLLVYSEPISSDVASEKEEAQENVEVDDSEETETVDEDGDGDQDYEDAGEDEKEELGDEEHLEEEVAHDEKLESEDVTDGEEETEDVVADDGGVGIDGELDEYSDESSPESFNDSNLTSTISSEARVFKLRSKGRRRGRRRRKPSRRRRPRRGRRRRPRRGRRPLSAADSPTRDRERPYESGKLITPSPPLILRQTSDNAEEPRPQEENQDKHGNLIRYGRPIGPFYSESNKIPLPDTPVLLAIYPKKKASTDPTNTGQPAFPAGHPPTPSHTHSRTHLRAAKFVRHTYGTLGTSTTTSTTTSKPYNIPTPLPPQPQNLHQTFNIALPASLQYPPPSPAPAPQPIVIQAPAPAIDSSIKTPTQTTFSVNAYLGAIPSSQGPIASSRLTPAGTQHPYKTYALSNGSTASTSTNTNCAPSGSSERVPVPTWTSYIQNSKGSHYYGRQVNSPSKTPPNCQYFTANVNKRPGTEAITPVQLSTPWVPSPASPSTVTRYYPPLPPTSSISFSGTPSQAYEVPQNIYQAFSQQKQVQPTTSSINSVQPGLNQFGSYAPNSAHQNGQHYFQRNLQQSQTNQYSNNYFPNPISLSASAPVGLVPSPIMNPPKVKYNYRTYRNNQKPAMDYEFPLDDHIDDYYDSEDIVKAKPVTRPKYNNKRRPKKTRPKPIRRPKATTTTRKKPKPSRPHHNPTTKKPANVVKDLFVELKPEIEVNPVKLFGKFLPEVKVTQTKKGKDFEFTIGK